MKKAQPSWRRFFSARSLFQSFWLKNDISSTIRTRSFISFNHYLEQFHLILKSWITCKALFTGIKRKRISRDFQNSEKADAVYNHFLSRLIRSLLHPFLNNNSKLANQAEKQSSRNVTNEQSRNILADWQYIGWLAIYWQTGNILAESAKKWRSRDKCSNSAWDLRFFTASVQVVQSCQLFARAVFTFAGRPRIGRIENDW